MKKQSRILVILFLWSDTHKEVDEAHQRESLTKRNADNDSECNLLAASMMSTLPLILS